MQENSDLEDRDERCLSLRLTLAAVLVLSHGVTCM